MNRFWTQESPLLQFSVVDYLRQSTIRFNHWQNEISIRQLRVRTQKGLKLITETNFQSHTNRRQIIMAFDLYEHLFAESPWSKVKWIETGRGIKISIRNDDNLFWFEHKPLHNTQIHLPQGRFTEALLSRAYKVWQWR